MTEAMEVSPSRNHCWGAQVLDGLLAKVLLSVQRCYHREIPQKGAARGHGFTQVLASEPTSRYSSKGEHPVLGELAPCMQSSPYALPHKLCCSSHCRSLLTRTECGLLPLISGYLIYCLVAARGSLTQSHPAWFFHSSSALPRPPLQSPSPCSSSGAPSKD